MQDHCELLSHYSDDSQDDEDSDDHSDDGDDDGDSFFSSQTCSSAEDNFQEDD